MYPPTHLGTGGEITEKAQKAKNVTVYSASARDFYIDGKNLDEVLSKVKKLMQLGVKSVTFQCSERTVYPGERGY